LVFCLDAMRHGTAGLENLPVQRMIRHVENISNIFLGGYALKASYK